MNTEYEVVEKNDLSKKLMTVKELSNELGIGINSCYDIVHREDFPKIKVGRKLFVIRSKVDEWIESNCGKQL